jgi:hypothetical protein
LVDTCIDIEYFVSGRRRDIRGEHDKREERCVVVLQDNLLVKEEKKKLNTLEESDNG